MSGHAVAQSAEIARLRLSLGDPLLHRNFVPDTAYVDILDRFAAMLLCREFAEANRGRFRIESEWGKGCRCYCSLPAAPAPM